MGILSWIVFGLIAGMGAKFVLPGRDPGGLLVTILVGIAGAVLGGYLGTTFGLGTVTGFDLRSLLLAMLGGIVLLFGFRLYVGRSET